MLFLCESSSSLATAVAVVDSFRLKEMPRPYSIATLLLRANKLSAKTSEDNVVVDGNITTSRGLGTAVDFALSLISQLENDEKAKEIAESVVYTR